ncbi:UDP-N-acetylmuramoyl-L-alanyl-D-glutamate--2,6-diaminopimelate ligase [Phycisphaera mikurensis]|uniref:UDP-N-acetylmuramoyl-L-alanyl-D-glutamate--2,6-diaminopimelate ligase n=1 Tax=Phycisphaera mikurensis (strain NBRC 102666 / KCTC 22515 / FYK2301M01) TaxID=1142394 RepID=I0IBR5_PHYMF|nr:UDP-N-acetylmuramoyl-L-alanyl-D-glutamate--2,6-diaminopimelate ligase [Phycisphaera mikurensis]MBB6442065.1 UDP-N-acetylmuramyl-tripeptide synthetase [Phycisphaera mikurensis]BAM02703.1 UDP-N-acetylmuramoyl-L-alanyl-D-glutamate--2,6-diaminopimelate ligase [Phycisphaera mikurensis NBRC 102666]
MEHDAALLAAAAGADPVGDAAGARVTGVSDDTRTLEPGDLFLLRGGGSGGPDRLAEAAAGGAAAAVVPAGCGAGAGLPLFRMPAGRPLDQAAAGRVADALFGRPADGLALVGVTGTNGKTTVATLTRHLLAALGVPCGLLGTVCVDTGGGPAPATLTTPGAIGLRRHFAAMRGNGLAAAALEASSHALDQGRTAGLSFAAAVFTNLTRDHLDYHGTMEAYADAKARLFGQLAADGVAVVNADDPAASRFAGAAPRDRVLRTSVADAAGADATAAVASLGATSAAAAFAGPWGRFEATLTTGGLHNVSNALQAVAAAWSVASRRRPGAATPAALAAALAAAAPVPGRLEPVAPPADADPAALPGVLVDYAHTPDALGRVLAALRPATAGRLIVVYGCGGDRDRTKRPLMTAAALAGADTAVLTSDNPRTEDPRRILDDAAAGAAAADRGRLSVEPDRRAAISAAVRGARPGDVVLIAGKGHEDYQLVSDGAGGIRRLRFDDREEAAAALRRS